MSAKSLATATERVGRATARVAGKIDKVMASRKKAALAKPAESEGRRTKLSKADEAAAARQTKVRGSWKAEERSAASAVKVQHGITIDERAHTRATSGQRWAARQTR